MALRGQANLDLHSQRNQSSRWCEPAGRVDIDDVIRQAATRKIEHLWLVGGGQLASAFLAKNLITHLSISEMPIQLNRGIPLFSDHDLNDIACEDRQVIDKGRFKQIEITISHQHPTR